MPTEYEPNENNFERRKPNSEPAPWEDARDGITREDDALWSLLSAYVDGEVTAEEAEQVEEMLRADPACARDLEFLRLAGRYARSYVELEPPAGLRESILAATSRRPTLARRVAAGWAGLRQALAPNFLRVAVPAGTVAAAAVTAFLLWPRHRPFAPVAAPGLKPSAPQIAMNTPPAPPKESEKAAPKAVRPAPSMSLAKAKPHRKAAPLRHKQPEPAIERPGPEIAMNVPRPVERPKLRPTKALPSLDKNLKRAKRWAQAQPGVWHRPKLDASSDPAAQVIAYSKLPMMDARNQRLAWMGQDDFSASDLRESDVAVSAPPAAAGKSGSTAAQPKDGDGTPKVASTSVPGKTVRVRIGHILREQLPPDPRLIASNADLKRERAAANLGYDRDAVQNIERRQAAVSLISGKF
ncbi:MAG TPA: hypothetical protein VFB38_03975 [Chthonomonadaceae bacterium]|nr:hypothetical protein [Chthonomonadaceae bacterium]